MVPDSPQAQSAAGSARSHRRAVPAVLLLCLLCFPLYGVRYFIDEVMTGNSRLRVQCTDQGMVNAMGFYGGRCSRLVDSVLGIHDCPAKKIWILEDVPDGERGVETPEQYLVVYRIGEDELSFAQDLFRALVRRRLERSLRREVRGGAFFDLVVAGLCHRFVRGRHALSGYYEPDYGIARDQFMRGQYPDLKVLLKTSIPLSHRYFHELYMLHSDLLILGLESLPGRRHGAVVWNLLKSEQRKKDLMGVFTELTKPLYRQGETAQGFYERTVFRVSRRRGRLSGEDVIAERVKELETVSVLGYEGGTALRRVPLEEMPKVLEDYRTDVQGVLRLENRFRSLCQASPYLLRASLNQYAQALAWIREGDIDRFKEEIGLARQAFRRALARQRAMNATVDRYEREHVPALRRFMDFVDVVKHYRELSKSLYPRDLFKEFEERR